MKAFSFSTAARNGAYQSAATWALAALVFASQSVSANLVGVRLGTASDYAVLAGSGITVAGAAESTTITGDIGSSPTPAITGLGNVVLNGVNQAGNAVTAQAKTDLAMAYDDAAGRAYNMTYALGYDFAGQTLTAGVYNDASSFFLSGTLTLDAQGNPQSVFIFQTGSTFITASDSKVVLIGGAQACHVFWQVGSSATLGTDTDFMGTILAATSITLDTGATLDGRALALNGAVTLDDNSITTPVCAATGPVTGVPDGGNTLALLGLGLGGLSVLRRRLILKH
ncbi:MAG TPA: ice-binding family protein [Verrucomicrobiae bacterium]|nr:ice-binding family protein [Verrucomicrobiae bacterium]